MSRGAGRGGRLGLAAVMLGAGVLHFLAPGTYVKVVPRWLGDARQIVLLSGAAELVCGALLLRPRTARLGGWLTAALLVVVFPANVQMALDAGTAHQVVDMPVGRFRLVALARLPLQIPLIVWAMRIARRS